MSEPSSPSALSETGGHGSVGPPVPAAATVAVPDLQRRHPLWERAARSGRDNGAGVCGAGPPPPARRGQGTNDAGGGEKPRFERLSAFALELEHIRGDGDGAESSIASESLRGADVGGAGAAPASGWRQKKGKQTHGTAPRQRCEIPNSVGAEEEEPEPDTDSLVGSEQEDDADDADATEGRAGTKRPRPRVSAASGDAAMLHAAAFGNDYDEDSDAESGAGNSQTSSVRRAKARSSAFPVRGVDCVGCALVTRIAPVERFLADNSSKMAETALWKSAALCYKQQIMEPCEREGVAVPPWGWREIQAHFTCHVVDDCLGRMGTVRLLQQMRMQAEQRLLRVEPDGSRELDKQSADLVLKLVAAESKERTLLQDVVAGRGGSGAARGVRGGKGGAQTKQ